VPARVWERARIVLLAADGVPGKQIAARVESERVKPAGRVPRLEVLAPGTLGP
jgi:hypothetical protein